MFSGIKKRIDRELREFITYADKAHSLHMRSPVLYRTLRDFVLRPGKRMRPVLFVIGYSGYARKTARGLYRSALAIELLHDFMLIHDDIIDKSAMRRGEPAAHTLFASYLKKFRGIKFSGEDMAIIAGDILYALALESFLAVREEPRRKEKAMGLIIQAALRTGMGEFIELTNEVLPCSEMKKDAIDTVYDYKTAFYTFACPLSAGAVLAGAAPKQVEMLTRYGMYLGRAFQIRDDILGMFADEAQTGKSALADLQEAKRTILVWYGYDHVSSRDRKAIEKLFAKKKVTRSDLETMRCLLRSSGALDYAEKEISRLVSSARGLLGRLSLSPRYRNSLFLFTQKLFPGIAGE